MFKEFKEFALKGNMMDLAIGMIIGAAFTGIIGSLVDDIINPILGIFGGMNFDDLGDIFSSFMGGGFGSSFGFSGSAGASSLGLS